MQQQHTRWLQGLERCCCWVAPRRTLPPGAACAPLRANAKRTASCARERNRSLHAQMPSWGAGTHHDVLQLEVPVHNLRTTYRVRSGVVRHGIRIGCTRRGAVGWEHSGGKDNGAVDAGQSTSSTCNYVSCIIIGLSCCTYSWYSYCNTPNYSYGVRPGAPQTGRKECRYISSCKLA